MDLRHKGDVGFNTQEGRVTGVLKPRYLHVPPIDEDRHKDIFGQIFTRGCPAHNVC